MWSACHDTQDLANSWGISWLLHQTGRCSDFVSGWHGDIGMMMTHGLGVILEDPRSNENSLIITICATSSQWIWHILAWSDYIFFWMFPLIQARPWGPGETRVNIQEWSDNLTHHVLVSPCDGLPSYLTAPVLTYKLATSFQKVVISPRVLQGYYNLEYRCGQVTRLSFRQH